jgi:hypothetical protein
MSPYRPQWLVAEVRPNLVKGITTIEGGGQPFAGVNVI